MGGENSCSRFCTPTGFRISAHGLRRSAVLRRYPGVTVSTIFTNPESGCINYPSRAPPATPTQHSALRIFHSTFSGPTALRFTLYVGATVVRQYLPVDNSLHVREDAATQGK